MKTKAPIIRVSRTLRRANGSGAFTLVELLLGMVISTMILAATSALFVSMVRSWDNGSREREVLQAAQTTADLIERHLRSAMPPGGNVIFRGEDLSTPDGYGHKLVFCSEAEGRFPRSAARSDASEVEFLFDPLADNAMIFRIDPSPDDKPLEGGSRFALSPLLRSFRVRYFDGTDWLDDWAASSLPLAVEFHFTIAMDDPNASAAQLDPSAPTPVEDFSRTVWMPRGGADQKSSGATTTGQSLPAAPPGGQGGQDGQAGQGGQPGPGGGGSSQGGASGTGGGGTSGGGSMGGGVNY